MSRRFSSVQRKMAVCRHIGLQAHTSWVPSVQTLVLNMASRSVLTDKCLFPIILK